MTGMGPMEGMLLGALTGLGLALVWDSCWPRAPRAPRLRPSWSDRVRDDLAVARWAGLTPWGLVAMTAGLGLVVLVLTVGVTGVLPVGLCFGLIAAVLPWAALSQTAARRRSRLRDAWPDCVDHVASAVRAGMALPEALAQLAVRGPEELRPAFAGFAHDYRATGRFHVSLDALRDRLADPVADRLVESLRIAREVGGSDLGVVLRTLSAFLREEAQTRAEIEARQSWTVNAARLGLAAPWIVLAMLATRGDSLTAYGTPTGAAVLLGGGVISVGAYLLMLRLGRLPRPERVLR
ncbi:tight adherence protein B [Kytococcus aerolatus]|uniref:Tight adherence protein B n=2 Tax=Kytococcus aerolatus TaxID=592308 RepID=A0A212U1K6_9MICO|nr:tight adherence protein B [Kytococcus aerolatus]